MEQSLGQHYVQMAEVYKKQTVDQIRSRARKEKIEVFTKHLHRALTACQRIDKEAEAEVEKVTQREDSKMIELFEEIQEMPKCDLTDMLGPFHSLLVRQHVDGDGDRLQTPREDHDNPSKSGPQGILSVPSARPGSPSSRYSDSVDTIQNDGLSNSPLAQRSCKPSHDIESNSPDDDDEDIPSRPVKRARRTVSQSSREEPKIINIDENGEDPTAAVNNESPPWNSRPRRVATMPIGGYNVKAVFKALRTNQPR